MKVEVTDKCPAPPPPPSVVITMTVEQAQMLHTLAAAWWLGSSRDYEEIVGFCTLLLQGLSDQRIYFWSPE